MTFTVVDPAQLTAEPGPHPAASPFDKRVSERLGLSAFESYFVDLPAHQETVRHTHEEDGVEDMYVVVRGSGWLVVDEQEVPVRPHQFVAVSQDAQRLMRAGPAGMQFVAVCSAPA